MIQDSFSEKAPLSKSPADMEHTNHEMGTVQSFGTGVNLSRESAPLIDGRNSGGGTIQSFATEAPLDRTARRGQSNTPMSRRTNEI